MLLSCHTVHYGSRMLFAGGDYDDDFEDDDDDDDDGDESFGSRPSTAMQDTCPNDTVLCDMRRDCEMGSDEDVCGEVTIRRTDEQTDRQIDRHGESQTDGWTQTLSTLRIQQKPWNNGRATQTVKQMYISRQLYTGVEAEISTEAQM